MRALPGAGPILLAIVIGLAPVSQAHSHQQITTELREVRTATLEGREWLTVRIHDNVGPIGCRGRVLAIDHRRVETDRARDLEAVALAAMLKERPVMLTVPLERHECVDGKPVIADIHLLPRVPE